MINIKEFFNIIKKYDIKEEDGHLILPENFRLFRKRSKIARSLFEALGDNRVENNFRIKKKISCTNEMCVSPQCYDFNLYLTSKTSNLSREDIIDIAEDMDLNRIYTIGEKAYFEEYNSMLPEVLKLTIEDYKIVISYLKGK